MMNGGNIVSKFKRNRLDIYEEGYTILDLGLTDSFMDRLNYQIFESIALTKSQEKGYHYNEYKRVFEAWKWCQEALELAKHPIILEFIEDLYGKKAKPFQTINFTHGTEQPLHSDEIHFCTEPKGGLVAAWVALEDITIEAGPLVVVPKSNELPFIDFTSLGLEIPEYGKQFPQYKVYENVIDLLVNNNPYYVRKPILLRKGEALIWVSNLLHGGSAIINKNKTRYSQATHYFLEGFDRYYCPMFNTDKDLSGKDILNHIIPEPIDYNLLLDYYDEK